MDRTSVLIVDDISTTREDIKRLLYFEEDIKVIGEAGDGEAAISAAESLRPDVILMDINMPGMDGIAASEIISNRIPESSVVILSIQKEPEYLRKAMAAGARDYLVKPFTSSDLSETIRRVGQNHKLQYLQLKPPVAEAAPIPALPDKRLVVVFASKGGVGKTTLACNLAISLSQESGQKVALIDLNLQSGDVALMLNILPRGTIAELVQEEDREEISLLDNYLYPHLTGVKVLPAPLKPEQADIVTARDIETIIKQLKNIYTYIVVDTPPVFNDLTLSALDLADDILLVCSPDLPSLKHTRTDLEVLERLHKSDKVKIVLNKATLESAIPLAEITKNLGFSPLAVLPQAEKMVLSAVNRGQPFMLTDLRSSLSQKIKALSRSIIPDHQTSPVQKKQKKFFFIGRTH